MQLKTKGFLLTVDALLALALLSLTPFASVLFSQESLDYQKTLSLQLLGFDYLELKDQGFPLERTEFKALTGYALHFVPPEDAGIAVNAKRFAYPPLCGGEAVVEKEDECLESQEASNQSFEEVWVSP